MHTYETSAIEKDLDNCEDLEDFIQTVVPKLSCWRSQWQQKLDHIFSSTGYSCKQFAQLCGVSEPAVRKWKNGALPQSRDMYIRIGFAAGYDLEEMNAFLKRYGRCPQLYAKSPEDIVCMFVLNSQTLPRTYATYQKLLTYVRAQTENPPGSAENVYSTGYLASQVADLQSEAQMLAFAREHAASFRDAYRRLYNFILFYLDLNLQSIGDDSAASFHAMANESKWSSSLRHCISEIRNRRWFPLRHKIISLGIHLNMDKDCINEMLEKAQMEPLYAKNPLEAAVIFAIEDAKVMSENDRIIPDGSNDLCRYVKDILKQIDLTDCAYLIDDL